MKQEPPNGWSVNVIGSPRIRGYGGWYTLERNLRNINVIDQEITERQITEIIQLILLSRYKDSTDYACQSLKKIRLVTSKIES